VDGIFNINKHSGNTSFEIVSLVRYLVGVRRVGHAGTLDPMASGVLPVCFGRGTRVIEFLMDATKTYRADIRLGISTDTYDTEGNVLQIRDTSGITAEKILSALDSFKGQIEQEPPMYSALKHNGQCLYELARAGITVDRETRKAQIYSLNLLNFTPPVITIEMECSKGTYVRSLANDLGEMLGCGACMSGLVRLKYGPFNIEEAVSADKLKEAFCNNDWQRLVYPIDTVVQHWASVTVGDEQGKDIKNGVSVSLVNNFAAGTVKCRAYNSGGSFLAILYLDETTGQWQPQKVFV
jgi:tRNA pseudouridine55 synthase